MPPPKRTVTLASIDKLSNEPIKTSISRIGENVLAGTYESVKLLQKLIKLITRPDQKKIDKLPAVWQQKFKELNLDQNTFMCIDERLINPEELREPFFRSLSRTGRQAVS